WPGDHRVGRARPIRRACIAGGAAGPVPGDCVDRGRGPSADPVAAVPMGTWESSRHRRGLSAARKASLAVADIADTRGIALRVVLPDSPDRDLLRDDSPARLSSELDRGG